MQKNDLNLLPVKYSDKSILRNLMQLYLYDFSKYDQEDVNPAGLYDYKYLDLYWTESNRYPFIFLVNDQLAGFALVNRHTDPVYNEERWSVAEFFILKKYRRQGIGSEFAVYIFDKFRGKWKVAQIENNLPAKAFWRKVIGEYTHGAYHEIEIDINHFQGTAMYFDNASREASRPSQLSL